MSSGNKRVYFCQGFLNNVITVSQKGGDFTDPVAAVNSITDSDADNPYLVVVGPGYYTVLQQIVLKTGVSITGAGRNATFIEGAISTSNQSTSSIITSANSSTISHMTIYNYGGGVQSLGIYLPAVSQSIIENVFIHVGGGSVNIGINDTSNRAVIRNSEITITSTSNSNYGMYCSNTTSKINNVVISVEGSNTYNTGISLSGGQVTLDNLRVSVDGGINATGLNISGAITLVTNSSISAENASNSSNGVMDEDGSIVYIRRSTLRGDSFGVFVDNAGASINQSTLIGGPHSQNSGTVSCVACDNGAGGVLGSGCL